ncbi:unnamed protein product, partial [Closterium sp. NIES-53]
YFVTHFIIATKSGVILHCAPLASGPPAAAAAYDFAMLTLDAPLLVRPRKLVSSRAFRPTSHSQPCWTSSLATPLLSIRPSGLPSSQGSLLSSHPNRHSFCTEFLSRSSRTRFGQIGQIRKHVSAPPARCSSKLDPSDDSSPESSQTPDDTFSGDKLGETQANSPDSPIGKLSNQSDSSPKNSQPDDSQIASVRNVVSKQTGPEANPSDESEEPSLEPSLQPGTSSLSDRAKERLQRIEEAAAAAKSGSDPFKGMVAVAAQRLQDYFDKTRLVGGPGGVGQESVGLRGEEVEGDDASGETAWQRWERVFGEVEEREAMLTSLQFQLDDLVGDEDFTAAAKLQAAIRALEEQDAMAAVFTELKAAVAEERYSDAKHLRDDAGAGLVGWWAGLDESGSADPFGRLVHVSQQHGKLLAKSYTAK